MAPRPTLSDIRDLADPPTREWRPAVFRLVGVAFSLTAFAATVLAAFFAWDARNVSHFPDAFFGIYAMSCVVIPLVIAWIAARRSGSEVVVLLAVILPVIVWIFVVIMIAVVGSLNGVDVF